MLKTLNRNTLLHIGFTILTIAILITVSTQYVQHERAIYAWDFGLYHDMTTLMAGMMRDVSAQPQNIPEWVLTILGSTALDYNYYHTLLPGVALLLFGNTRSTYIAAITTLYMLAYVLSIGALAKQLIAPNSKWVFWSAVFIALILPGTWVSVLRGYPDVGVAACITLAIALYLRDPKLKRNWQILLIGFLLGIAPIIRRHFVYDVILLLPLATGMTLFIYYRDPDERHPILQAVMRVVLIVFTMLLSLALFGFPFVFKTLTTNYTSLYAGYERPSDQVVAYFLNYNGWIIWLLAVVGVAWGYHARRWQRWQTAFVLMFYGSLFLAWILLVKELGYQYTAHFTAFVIIGLTSLLWTVAIKLQRTPRSGAIAVMTCFLVANFIIALAPVSIFPVPNSESPNLQPDVSKWFSMVNPPLRDPDYDEIFRMVDYLQQMTGVTDPIYVAASSFELNQSTLRTASVVRFKQLQPTIDDLDISLHLNILPSPDIDSRDFYPLSTLLRAQYVVTVSPVQYHLNPDMQRVVTTVASIFEDRRKFADDFELLPQQFHLSNGALILIYKRIRPTSLATSWQTVLEMQQAIGARPGSQTVWMALLAGTTQVSEEKDSPDIAFDLNPDVPMPFLYLDSLPTAARVTGTVNVENCEQPSLQLMVTGDDLEHPLQSIMIPTDQPSFDVSLDTHNAQHLLLVAQDQSVDTKADALCHMSIQNLVVHR